MDSTQELVRIPACWMNEAQTAYRQYCDEWRREESERVLGTGDSPEEPQEWHLFFREYLYAELEAATFIDGA